MQRPSSSPQPGETQEGVRTTDVAIRGLDAKGQQSKVDVKKAAIIGGSLLLVAVVAIVLIVVLAGGSSSSHHDAPLPQDDGTGDTLTGINTTGLLPPERATTWNPGLNAVGGIPHRTAIFKTLSPSGGDDTALINKAIEDCPANQVVMLSAGTFSIRGDGIVIAKSNVTLRGAGPDKTKLVKVKGTNMPTAIIGARWYKYTAPIKLAANAVKGTNYVTLESNPGFWVGEFIVINMLHHPDLTQWSTNSPDGDDSRGWFMEYNRPFGQVLEISRIEGNTLYFTTPFHHSFYVSQEAHALRYLWNSEDTPRAMVTYSGIEDVYLSWGEGGDQGGNVHLFAAMYSWVRNVESDLSNGGAIQLDGTFRSVLRDSYIHSTVDPNPGGAGYGIVLEQYASDNLVENCISWNFNKVMHMRTTGGGNVIGYNYMEDGWISYAQSFVETGLSASHMTTPHYELFEGNLCFNFASDATWGNAIYVTVFRNHLTGHRRSIAPLSFIDREGRRACEVPSGHWWYSFFGNVLGTADQSPAPYTAFSYEGDSDVLDPIPMWRIADEPKVKQTLIRHGNFDYLTFNVTYEPTIERRDMPNSFYLLEKPAFMSGLTWPWVTADRATKVHGALPARARFDAIHGTG